MTNLEQKAEKWLFLKSGEIEEEVKDFYCENRDVFQTRLNKLLEVLLGENLFSEERAYMLLAIVGEIGNNSFDHNLGNWPDVPGIYFGYEITDGSAEVILADRGVGVLNTLKRVKPSLSNDKEALKVAFTERISGRAPENRGNGLKFVRSSLKDANFKLFFYSGDAEARLNEKMKILSSKQKINGCLAIIKA